MNQPSTSASKAQAPLSTAAHGPTRVLSICAIAVSMGRKLPAWKQTSNRNWATIDSNNCGFATSPQKAAIPTRPPQVGAHGEIDISDAAQLGNGERQHNLRIGVESDTALSCNIFGNAVEMKNPSAAIAVRGSNLLVSEFGADALDGDFTGRMKLAGVFFAGEQATQTSGSFELRNAKLFDTAAGHRLTGLVQESFLLSPALLHRQTVEMSASFSMSGSHMIADHLVFTSSLLEANGSARIDLRNQQASGDLTVLPLIDGGDATTFQFDGALQEPVWKAKD